MLTSEIGAVKDENVKLKSQVESLFKDEVSLFNLSALANWQIYLFLLISCSDNN